MKGIILAGGLGTRLAPLTKDTNKHLLPVYDKLMVEYPIRTLVEAGITDIVLVTGGKRPGAFLEYLKNGRDFGIDRLYYTYQEGNGGIGEALGLAEPFMHPDEGCVVILGDNYFENREIISQNLKVWKTMFAEEGSLVFLRQTETPWHFGIAEVKDDVIVSIEEKPSEPKSDLAVLGCYAFDAKVWSYLKAIKPSGRGELEITDVLEQYMKTETLGYSMYNGYWNDMGTFQTWMEVSKRAASNAE